MTKKNLYVSFLDLKNEKYINGGNLENLFEIEVFKKRYKNLDILFKNEKLNKGEIKKRDINGNIFEAGTFYKFIPIFGKRVFLTQKFLSKYKSVIISDSRNIIPFFQALISGKEIIFKSHGSNPVMFFSYLKAEILNLNFLSLIFLKKLLYYVPIIFIFFFIELFIFIFANKIYIMRSKKSMLNSFWGNLYCLLFSFKTEFSYCCYYLGNSFEKFSLNKKNKIVNENHILFYGNWKITHNFSSICNFIKRFDSAKKTKLYFVGDIREEDKKILHKYLNKNKYEYEIFGYQKDLTYFKKLATHVVSCSHFGSGIPIKSIEIFYDSFNYDYLPIFSNYCKEALIGILDLKFKIYPKNGKIILD